MEIVAFGTSLMWGQGLRDADKMHNVLARKLQGRRPDRTVHVTFLAHSGAATGYLPDGSVDTRTEPPLHGEVPTHYPTVLQEIDSFDQVGIAPEAVDLILLDAGINDVHLKRVLDPLTRPQQIENMAEVYCHQHMVWLLEKLLTKFPKARIVIAGYYEFLTEDSEAHYIRLLLKAFGKVPGDNVLGRLADAPLVLFADVIRRRLLVNCDTFSEASWAAFCRSADELNARSPNEKRVLTARLDLKPEHAAFASDPWLFGFCDDLSPEDPMAEVRAKNCRTAGKRAEPVFCRTASTGHPNPKGAEAFADAMLAALAEFENTNNKANR